MRGRLRGRSGRKPHSLRLPTGRSELKTPKGAMAARRLILFILAALMGATATFFLVTGCGDEVLDRARAAEKAGDLRMAAELYRERLVEDPEDPEAIQGLAVALFLLQDYDGALPFQEKAVAINPDDVQLKVELAFNYLNHQGQPEKAVAVLSQAAAVERSAKILSFLAQAEMAAGRPADAEASLRAALAEDAAYGWAYTLLVQLLEAQGKQREADEVRQAAAAAGVVLGTTK